ncbi:MAG: prefoldin subunit alpha [Candidatus Altiarchaeales archaeon IMC4]|nr:MAG: prefoldin subunit alpha [Candidatus Altiarchaeales archaeon IMC4]
MENKEELNQLVMQIEEYKRQFNEVLREIQMMDAALVEIEGTKEAIGSIASELNTLIPLGSNVYARGEISDGKKVVMGIGAGVFVEKTIDDAVKALGKRNGDVKKEVDDLRKTAEKIGNLISQLNQKAEELVGKGQEKTG